MPPAAATAAARRSHATSRRAAATVPAGPRRVSGPSKGARRRKAAAAPRPLGFRIIEAIHRISEHRLVDRLVRGRAWIAIVGVGLIGIVFMQVSMLRMNTGIGESVQRASVLERQNAALEANISRLSSSEAIRKAAAAAGMTPAADATENFLDASDFSMAKAVNGITAPDTTPEAVTTSQTSTLAASAAAAKAQQDAVTAGTAGTAGTTGAAGTTGTAATGTTQATGTAMPASGTTTTGTTAAATTAGAATAADTTAQASNPQANRSATVAGGAAATGP